MYLAACIVVVPPNSQLRQPGGLQKLVQSAKGKVPDLAPRTLFLGASWQGCGRLFAVFQRDRGGRPTVYGVCAAPPLRKDEARALLALMEMLLASWQDKVEGSSLAHLAADPGLLGSLQAALEDTLHPFTHQGAPPGEPPVYPRVHFQRPCAQHVDEVAPPPGAGAGAEGAGGAAEEEEARELAWELEEKRRRRERNLAIQSMRSKSGIPEVHRPSGATLHSDASASARALGMSMPMSRMQPHLSSILQATGATTPGQTAVPKPEALWGSLDEPGKGPPCGAAPAAEGDSEQVPGLPLAGASPASGYGTPREALAEGGVSQLIGGPVRSRRVLRTSSSEGPERQRSGSARSAASPDIGGPDPGGGAATGAPPLHRSGNPYLLSPASWQGQPSPTARARAEAESSGRLTPRERLLIEIAEMQSEVEWRGSATPSTASSLASPSPQLPISDSAPILTPSTATTSDRGSPASFGSGAPRSGGRKAHGLPKPLFRSHTPTGGVVLRRSVTASAEREGAPPGAESSQGRNPGYAGATREGDAVDWTALRSWTFTAAGAQELKRQALGAADLGSFQACEQSDDSYKGRAALIGFSSLIYRDEKLTPTVHSWNTRALFPSSSVPATQTGPREMPGLGARRRSFGLMLARQMLAPARVVLGEDSGGGSRGVEGRTPRGLEDAITEPREEPSLASQDSTGPSAPQAGGAPEVHHRFPDLAEGAGGSPGPASPNGLEAQLSAGCLPHFGPRVPSSRAEAPGAASTVQGRHEGVSPHEEAVVVVPCAEGGGGASESSGLTEWEAYLGPPLGKGAAPPLDPSQQGAGARAQGRAATQEAKGKGEGELTGVSEGAADPQPEDKAQGAARPALPPARGGESYKLSLAPSYRKSLSGQGQGAQAVVAPGQEESAPKHAAPSPSPLQALATRSPLAKRMSWATSAATGPSATGVPDRSDTEGGRGRSKRASFTLGTAERPLAHFVRARSQSQGIRAGGEVQPHLAVSGEAGPGGVPGDIPREPGAGTQRRRSFTLLHGPWRPPVEAGAEETRAGRPELDGKRRSFTLLPTASRDSSARAQQTGQARASRRRSFATVRVEVGNPVEESARPEASASGPSGAEDGDSSEGSGDGAMSRGKGKGLSSLLKSAGGLWPFERKGGKDVGREERLVA